MKWIDLKLKLVCIKHILLGNEVAYNLNIDCNCGSSVIKMDNGAVIGCSICGPKFNYLSFESRIEKLKKQFKKNPRNLKLSGRLLEARYLYSAYKKTQR